MNRIKPLLPKEGVSPSNANSITAATLTNTMIVDKINEMVASLNILHLYLEGTDEEDTTLQ